MLRLVYHTQVFGPLHFEYAQRVVRVGSCRDNDLVLAHPSVKPYDCALVLEENSLCVVSATAASGDGELVQAPAGPRYGPGDTLRIGEVSLSIERSPRSVDLPAGPAVTALAPGQTPEGYWRADHPEVPDEARWLCGRCALRLTNRHVHVLGLVGQRKYALCPKCSQTVELVGASPSAAGFFGRLRAGWRRMQHWLHRPPPA